jgi:hypothetical protein
VLSRTSARAGVSYFLSIEQRSSPEGAMKTISKIITGSIVALALAITIAATPASAGMVYLNTGSSVAHSSLAAEGIVAGPANYNDYHGLNGGSVCELPVYNSWGNVTSFRQGNC